MNDPIEVYGGLYFAQRAADQFCDGMNDLAGVSKCPTGALRLEGPYVVRPLAHINSVVAWIVTKED